MKHQPLGYRVVPAARPFDITEFKQAGRNVLVVSPHPDDDVLGVGGAMALLAQKGLNVFSLYVTDGAGGTCGGKVLPGRRQREAVAALRAAGARAGIFLNLSSRFVKTGDLKKTAAAIRDVLAFLMPGAVYSVSPFERHITHRRVAEMTAGAIRQIRGYQPQLWGYSVWGGVAGLPGTCVVDITSVVGIKRQAIARHKSQLSYKAYADGMLGRNRYEGIYMHTHGPESFQYAETLLDMRELVMSRRLNIAAFKKKVLGGLLFHDVS